MSDTTPDTSAGDKKPKPIFNPDDVVEPAVDFGDSKPAGSPSVDRTPADVAVEEPAVVAERPAPVKKPKAEKLAKPPVSKVDASGASATGSVAADADAVPGSDASVTPAATSDFAGREVVYVQAPVPPRLRGNRGVGSALAVLGALVFAVLFAGTVTLAFALNDGSTVAAAFTGFIQNAAFWVPVLVFLLAFVLLVLIVNRAGWAAHVFGSLLVALAVYFGSIGILLLLGVVIGAGDGEALGSFGALATNPIIIIAALVAREVSIWIGLAIAARGRRVKARNLELVDEWEQEHAETKAQYERAGSTT